MPDQAPPTPEGCAYGPWWDEIREDWFAYDGDCDCMIWNPEHERWDQEKYYAAVATRELLRLANENAELRASQTSEEDRAVLWLMKKTGKFYSFDSDKQCWQKLAMLGIRMVTVDINPAEEARKLGWKP